MTMSSTESLIISICLIKVFNLMGPEEHQNQLS